MPIPAAIAEAVAGDCDSEWEHRADFPPGPQAALCLAGERHRLADLPDADLLQVMAAARRQTAWAQERELAAIAELSRRRHAEQRTDPDEYRVLTPHECVVDEVSVNLSVTGNSAAALVHLAGQLTTQLPGTRAALAAGRLDYPKARVICQSLDGIDPHIGALVEAAVLPEAATQTTGQLRRRITRILRRLAPHQLEDRKRATQATRRLEVFDNPAGTADLALLDVPAEDAHAIHNKITAVAKALRADGDPRPLNALRADLATTLLRGGDLATAIGTLPATAETAAADAPADAPHPARQLDRPQQPSAPTPVQVPAPASVPALAALDLTAPVLTAPDLAAPDLAAPDSAAATDAAMANALAGIIQGRLSEVRERARSRGLLDHLAILTVRAVQDMQDRLAVLRESWCQSTGSDPDRHGHPGYRPPVALRRLVESRHPRCVFPTCSTPASRCDLDHTQPYDKGGPTCRCNLAPLCRRHHRCKQTLEWKLFHIWPGLLVWITPSGSWHIILPDRE